nr:HipA domain-containing protein [uncultured Schaedlerella sp.]
MGRDKNDVKGNPMISSGLYVLKHKDLDVAMVQIDRASGKIEYVPDIFLPEELPPGVGEDGGRIAAWWASRAVPDTRRGIQQVLNYLREETNLSLMLSAYGLSLTDHYWMQPIGEELYWKDLNFYDHEFSDELGNLLTGSGRIDMESRISKFSPASSVNGEMKKKWVIMDNIRYLMKVNMNDYGQQAVNEVIASRLHERLGWKNYVSYQLDRILAEGREYPCSLNPMFTSSELEFVSAYQLVKDYKVPNAVSEFEAVISQAVQHGMDEGAVREQLDYTIMTDFILSNTDRHYNNFGFLYDSSKHRLTAMAPIFDTGNALFYNQEIIPSGRRLLNIPVSSFCGREVDMLRYVKQTGLVDLKLLDGFCEEAERMLKKYTDMPETRAAQIACTIRQKMEYLDLFQQGKKIWKMEKYW